MVVGGKAQTVVMGKARSETLRSTDPLAPTPSFVIRDAVHTNTDC